MRDFNAEWAVAGCVQILLEELRGFEHPCGVLIPGIASEWQIDGQNLFAEIQAGGGEGSGGPLSFIIQKNCRSRGVGGADRLEPNAVRSQTVSHGEEVPFRLHA